MIVTLFWVGYLVVAFAGPPTVLRILLTDHHKRGEFAEIGTGIYIVALLFVGAILNADAILPATITFAVATLLWIVSLRYKWEIE
jgi:hypothetical protein